MVTSTSPRYHPSRSLAHATLPLCPVTPISWSTRLERLFCISRANFAFNVSMSHYTKLTSEVLRLLCHQKSLSVQDNRQALISRLKDPDQNKRSASCSQLAERNGQKPLPREHVLLQQLPWLTSLTNQTTRLSLLRLIPMKWSKNHTPNPNPRSPSIRLPP